MHYIVGIYERLTPLDFMTNSLKRRNCLCLLGLPSWSYNNIFPPFYYQWSPKMRSLLKFTYIEEVWSRSSDSVFRDISSQFGETDAHGKWGERAVEAADPSRNAHSQASLVVFYFPQESELTNQELKQMLFLIHLHGKITVQHLIMSTVQSTNNSNHRK